MQELVTWLNENGEYVFNDDECECDAYECACGNAFIDPDPPESDITAVYIRKDDEPLIPNL